MKKVGTCTRNFVAIMYLECEIIQKQARKDGYSAIVHPRRREFELL